MKVRMNYNRLARVEYLSENHIIHKPKNGKIHFHKPPK